MTTVAKIQCMYGALRGVREATLSLSSRHDSELVIGEELNTAR